MILGIDASKIRTGGGLNHLVELLGVAQPREHGFEQVVVWGSAASLGAIADRAWLRKVVDPLLDKRLPFRVYWQTFRLCRLAQLAHCDLLFLLGAGSAAGFRPVVAMSQNLLPFQWRELSRFGWSSDTFRFLILRWTQSGAFATSNGVIYLTEYARAAVQKVIGPQTNRSVVIPHGINERFFGLPRHHRQPDLFTWAEPCKVLYVSTVSAYKHQWHVAEAVAQLRAQGTPVALELVGPPGDGLGRLQHTLRRVDPRGEFIVYRGEVPHGAIESTYAAADIGVVASSCESFGQIVTEVMSAGLPIASSNRSAMPEILGDAAIYFDPEDPADIARALRSLIDAPDLRARLGLRAIERARSYSWPRCASETFGFLSAVARTTQRAGG